MKPPETRRGVRATQSDEQLGGRLEDAAIVLLSLDQTRLQQILGRFDKDELRNVSRAMAGLGRISMERIESAISRLCSELGKTSSVFGGMEATERLLRQMLPGDRADEILDEIRGPDGKTIWEKMQNVSPEMLAGYLRNEHPQTAAVVLSKIASVHAARVLKLLPNKFADDLAIRLVRMEPIQKPVLDEVQLTLQREFVSGLARSYDREPDAILAEILNRADAEQADRILKRLEETEPSAAARIRRRMFTFEDLVRIDRSTFGVLVAETPAERLPVALSRASTEIRELFLASMSERAGSMIRDELATMPKPRPKMVDEAQAEIIAIAKRLIDESRIFLADEESAEDAG